MKSAKNTNTIIRYKSPLDFKLLSLGYLEVFFE